MTLDSMIDAARASRPHLDEDRRAAILTRVLADGAPTVVTPLLDAPVGPWRWRRTLAVGAAGLALAAAVTLLIVELGAPVEPAPRAPAPEPAGVPRPPAAPADDPIVRRAPSRKTLPPTTLESYRLTGDSKILPDPATRDEMQRVGINRLTAAVKLCIDGTGRPTTVDLLGTSGMAAYDAKLLAGVRTWTYRPVLVDGVATEVCSIVSFVYRQ